MVNMTLSIPEELYKTVKSHSEIKWSEIARRAMWEHARKLELMNQLTAKSSLTQKDAIDIGRAIKEGIAKRHGLAK